jgi:hypothetical protein
VYVQFPACGLVVMNIVGDGRLMASPVLHST